jgi:hypothetical protein
MRIEPPDAGDYIMIFVLVALTGTLWCLMVSYS